MNSIGRRMLLVAAGALILAGCEGDDGADGTAGPAGAAGADGFSCWDLNQNGIADPAEDLNGDGTIDTLDCREPLPGSQISVGGKVSTAAGPLDRFVSVYFVPDGGTAADAIDADVENDGSYFVKLAEGDYAGYASRPGYEDDMVDPFAVVDGAANTHDFVLDEIADGEFIGSEDCGVCHTIEYASFVQSGHPYKLNKVVDGQQPIYPFTTLNGVLQRIFDDDTDLADPAAGTDNGLGTPTSWADVSYVIGGYFWKARFVDMAGAVVTGSEVQYNFATDGMVGYHDNEQDKPYNCGNCHTTGWRHQDDELNDNRQDGLAFMDGTFFEGGVHCEACHSAGSRHAKFRGGIVREATPRTLADLTMPDAGFGMAIACGECHTRDGERDYPSYLSGYDNALAAAGADDPRPNEMGGRIAVSGGLIKHHEQYDEILGIDPDTLDTVRSGSFMGTHGDCGTCHSPHGSSVNASNPFYTGMPGVDASNDGCIGCHGDYDPALRIGGMLALDCVDCHMPDLAKSATAVAAEDDRPAVGDVASHIFKIVLDSGQPQFTDSGSFAYPAIDEDWACRTCHNASPTGELFALPDAFIDTYVYHNNIVD
jgi:hypothetical protein